MGPRRRLTLLLATAALLAPAMASAAPAMPGPAACPGAERLDLPVAAQQKAMTCLVNRTRQARGLAVLRPHSALARSTSLKAKAILRCESFSHTPCGQAFTATLTQSRYPFRTAAENIAYGGGPYASAWSTYRSWMASPGHRANILNHKVREHAVVVIPSTSIDGADDVALWVQQFAAR